MTVIATERLVLRPPAEGDLADMLTLWGDARVLRHLGRPGTREQVWARLLKYAGHWSLFGFGYWMVRDATTGRFLGEAGVAFQQRGEGEDDPEAGWAFTFDAQGKGYASEALAEILARGDATFGWPRVTCLISADNAPSLRLAERHDFRNCGEVMLADEPIGLFERLGT
jgi:RimJ/RimL family protein N-acetyltransferase